MYRREQEISVAAAGQKTFTFDGLVREVEKPKIALKFFFLVSFDNILLSFRIAECFTSAVGNVLN